MDSRLILEAIYEFHSQIGQGNQSSQFVRKRNLALDKHSFKLLEITAREWRFNQYFLTQLQREENRLKGGIGTPRPPPLPSEPEPSVDDRFDMELPGNATTFEGLFLLIPAMPLRDNWWTSIHLAYLDAANMGRFNFHKATVEVLGSEELTTRNGDFSTYRVEIALSRNGQPESGYWWVDKETRRIVRVELQSRITFDLSDRNRLR